EFLQSKGFEIDNKPTAKLNAEMVDAVYDKFKKEKIAAEKQRQKLEKHKQIRRISDAHEKGEEPEQKPVHVEEPIIESVEKEKVIAPKKPEIIEIPPAAKIPEEKTVEVEKEKVPKIEKPIDKEEGEKPKTKVDKEIKLEKKEEIEVKPEPEIKKEVAGIQPPTPSKKIEAKPVEITEKVVKKEDIEKPSVKIEPKGEKKEEIKKEAAKQEEKVVPVVETLVETVEKPAGEAAPEKSKSRRRKKRKRVAEVQFETGEAPKLKGLTIVGKIDLEAEKALYDRKDRKDKRKLIDIEDEEGLGRAKSKPHKFKKRQKGKEKVVIVKEKTPDKKRKRRTSLREMFSEEDVDRAIKQTLAGMEETSHISQRSKMRQKKRAEREEKELKKLEEKEIESKTLNITEFVTTNDLANLMGVNPSEIILKCIELGQMVSINQRLERDIITLISSDYGFDIEFLDDKTIQTLEVDDDDDKDLLPRSPIVTVMGHVDHGKTSLLDFIRSANVVAGEAGGITQHIGAYQVDLEEKHITFLDTPGHEAFTAMRARGAQVTDIVVLVVAADDSVMPQTIEAISHAQAANSPIIVAINKIDKPDARPERIKQQLADHNILIEEWGGKFQSVEISAKKGINVDLLLEKILLEADILELKANPDRKARCAVIESNMDRGLGPVATVIVQKGTLKTGDSFVAGVNAGRVRIMFDERGNKVDEADPSMPVRVIGFDGLCEAGDILAVVGTDIEARVIANERQQVKREQEFRKARHVTLDDISKQIQIGGIQELFLIIKGDVAGSVEALSDSLLKLSRDEARVVILHKGVGSITESDVMLAVASRAVIIGFQVSPTAKARKLSDKEAVDVRLYNIIYDCINEIRLALEGLLTPELKEDVTSTIEVRKVFKISKLGLIAGCYVQNGKINRNDRVRLLRDGLPVYNGTIHSLKREKDDVREVDTGYECGIMLDGYHEIEIGDILEGYKITEVKRNLS
ncbi:MAG: translation initiation factor, partial [Bacteroidota bacterium]|nr:translation initiation factor [Bacteroidota bacterium]